MKITFILPGFIKIPVGGVKVVNEYANRLSDHGHEVTLIYPIQINTGNPIYFIRKKISSIFDRLQHVSDDLYYIPKPSVSVMVIQQIISKYIPFGDAVIAVGWQTAEAVASLPPEHGRKFYLLQSFETYFFPKKRILATYHLPLKKIAVSKWIMDEMEKIGENCLGPLGNAVHHEEFYLESPQSERRNDVMMVYHPNKIKGAKDGIEVLKMAKKRLPELTAVFVAPRKPIHRIPSWIEVIIRPSIDELRQLYNSSKIFLHTSHWEGWPLPPMEAMACGCAIVSVGNRGVCEFLTNQEDALIVPIGDKKVLLENLIRVISDFTLSKKLAENSHKTAQNYHWDSCCDTIEKILTTEI